MNATHTKENIASIFTHSFGKTAEHWMFAPGRANIIGEHTDYNEGFVLPFAISKGVWFAAAKNDTGTIRLYAADANEWSSMDKNETNFNPSISGTKYFEQVLRLLPHIPIQGIEIVFGGDLPVGSGVSSSSAITCGFVALLNSMFGLDMSDQELLKLAISAERGQGVRGGIMDQYTILHGVKEKAILLDCKDNSSEYLPLHLGTGRFYLIDTQVKHNLVNTDYNNRRKDVEEAISIIHSHYKPIQSLRELNRDDLVVLQSMLEDKYFRRVSFVVQENQRVLSAKIALQSNDLPLLGTLLYESHDGLSQMYEVSCKELDWLVDFTLDLDEISGARMMGGGFGGCTINLSKNILSESTLNSIRMEYKKQFGHLPAIFEVSPADGILALKNGLQR